MLKTKYERMSKEEKKRVCASYKETPAGKEMLNRLFRLNVIGILGMGYSVIFLIVRFSKLQWSDYFIMVPLFLFSAFFLFMAYKLKKKVLNQFVLKKK